MLAGAELHFVDATGLLTGVVQIAPPSAAPGESRNATLHFSFAVADIPGRPVEQVLPIVRLLSHFEPPNELQLRPEYGNHFVARAGIDAPFSSITQAGLVHLEDLATLQQYAAQPILTPDEIDPPFATELREYVRLLQGEVVTGTWDELTMHMKAGVSRTDLAPTLMGAGALAVEQEMFVDLDGQGINLGRFTTILSSAQLPDDQPEEDSLARLVPGDDPTFTRRAGPLISD